MANFYVHDGIYLIRSGSAPDGMERLQAGPGEQVVVGDPPACGTPPYPGACWHIHRKTWVDMRTAEQRDFDALDEVRTQRRTQYLPIADQLDMLWHAMDAGTMPKIEPWYSHHKSVKESNPKPSVE